MSESKRPSCEICGKVFKNSYNLTVHKQIHTGERLYKCSYCDRSFSHPSSYSEHVVSEHKEEIGNPNFRIPALRFASHATPRWKTAPEKTSGTCVFLPTEFTCTICSLKYTSKPALRSHMRLHRLTNSLVSNTNNALSKLAKSPSNVCRQGEHSKVPSASTSTPDTKVSGLCEISKLQTHESTPSNKTPSIGDNMNRKAKEYITMICKPNLSSANGCSEHSKSTTAGRQDKGQNIQTESEPPEVVDDRIVTEKSQTEGRLDCRNKQSQTNSQRPHVFTCAECEETFLKTKDLSQHMILHPNFDEKNSRYRCPKCKEVFVSLINLRQHIVSAHKKLDKLNITKLSKWSHTYECSICKQGFNTLYSFTRHKRLHKNNYECRVCGKGFDRKREQQLHSKTHYDQGPLYKCQHCPCSFTLEENRRRHNLRMHSHSKNTGVGKPCGITNVSPTDGTCSLSNKCTQCGSSFTKKHLLQKHVMKVHWKADDRVNKKKQRHVLGKEDSGPVCEKNRSTDNATKYDCDTCGASYSTRYDLKRHIIVKHFKDVENIGPLNKTLDSEKKERSEAELRECVVVCDSSSRYYCEHCEANYTKRSYLRNHMITKHYMTVQNAVPLNKSMESEKRKAILREYDVAWDKLNMIHTDPVTGENFYVCDVCSTTYTSKSSLGKHVRNRASDHGIYLRKRSERITKKRVQLSTKCDICGNIFARRYAMLLHRRKHTDDQFSSAGVRRNLYRTPDGTFVDVFGPLSRKPTAEHEVSSSTGKDTESNDVRDTNSDNASVYVDIAEDEFVSMETEPLFFARPYVTKEHIDDTNSVNTTSNIDVTSGTLDCDQTFHCKEKVNTFEQRTLHSANKMQLPAMDQIGLKEQMNLDTTGNTQNQIDVGQCIEIIDKSVSGRPPNRTSIKQTNTIDLANNIKQPNTSELSNTPELINTPELTNTPEQRNALNEINLDILPCTSSQGTDEVNTAGLSPQPALKVGDVNVCLACSIPILEGQNRLKCTLCNKSFCQLCSGISTETYDVMLKQESRSVSGILWSCQTCRLLVPKFTIILQKLGDFEYAINNRLSELEKRFLKIQAN